MLGGLSVIDKFNNNVREISNDLRGLRIIVAFSRRSRQPLRDRTSCRHHHHHRSPRRSQEEKSGSRPQWGRGGHGHKRERSGWSRGGHHRPVLELGAAPVRGGGKRQERSQSPSSSAFSGGVLPACAGERRKPKLRHRQGRRKPYLRSSSPMIPLRAEEDLPGCQPGPGPNLILARRASGKEQVMRGQSQAWTGSRR